MNVPKKCKDCIFRERFMAGLSICARLLYTGKLLPDARADGSCPAKDTTSEIVEIRRVGESCFYKVIPKSKQVPKKFLKHWYAYKNKQIKQKDLAAQLGVSCETIRRWANLMKEREKR